MDEKETNSQNTSERKKYSDSEMKRDILKAIESEGLEIYLQPIMDLDSFNITSAEALVRWNHPKYGFISPGVFIPIIENDKTISRLDKYMFELVCRLLRRWIDEKIRIIPITINISRISLEDAELPIIFSSLIKEYGLSTDNIVLEITESAYINNEEKMKSEIQKLRNYGFKIYMDDFGSGYSSLNSLRNLPLDCIKLDLKFLSDSNNDSRGRLILLSLVQMTKALQIPVIIEGVEKAEHVGYIKSIGCDSAQGYLFSMPVPIKDFETLIKTKKYVLEHKSKAKANVNSGNIQKLLSDTSESLRLLTETIPIALSFISIDKEVKYLRANHLFFEMLNIKNDLSLVSEALENILSTESIDLVKSSYKKCAKTHKPVNLIIKLENNKTTVYDVKIVYEGDIGNASVLLVTISIISLKSQSDLCIR